MAPHKCAVRSTRRPSPAWHIAMPSGWSRSHHQTNVNQSPFALPHPSIRQPEVRAIRVSGGAGKFCGCCGSGDGAPSESGCAPRHGLTRTSATFAYAGTATLPALVVGTAGANSLAGVEPAPHLAVITGTYDESRRRTFGPTCSTRTALPEGTGSRSFIDPTLDRPDRDHPPGLLGEWPHRERLTFADYDRRPQKAFAHNGYSGLILKYRKGLGVAMS